MTTTWHSTLGAVIVIAALCVAPEHPFAQTTQQGPPQRPPGAAAAPLPPLPVTQLDERLPVSARSAQNFSLSFSEPQPIRDVLLLVLKDTGLSVVIDPDVTGTFTGELANVTLKQALEIALPPLGLQYSLADNVLRVSRRPTETRFFSVDYVVTRRSSERTTSAPAGLVRQSAADRAGSAGVAGGSAVTSSDATDFYEELSHTVGPLLSADGSFTIDRKAGLVRVTDYPDRLDRVSHYLELAELRATRQVQIQATFVEIDLNDAASSGIDWTAVLQAAGDAVTPARRGAAGESGGVFSLGLNVRSLDGLLKAFATQGVVNVLASPRVAVMNNEPAIVRASTQRIVLSTRPQVDRAAGRAGQRVTTPEATTDGVVLTVTPQISADRIIQMSVAPSVARETGRSGAARGEPLPVVSIRGADTLVRVREGETVVIDGLMQAPARSDRPKARGLAGVPILGSLFRRHAKPAAVRKTELVILLTPTIVDRSP